MYRDFVYMDTDRVQSIIAQLEQGILEQIMEGKVNELQGKAQAGLEGSAGSIAGVLASFLPSIGFEGGVSKTSEVQYSKVLHDYAFNIALKSLMENELCIEVEDWERENIPLTDTAFILVRGNVSILDYALLKNLAEDETISRAFLGGLQTQSQQSPKGRGSSSSSKQKEFRQVLKLMNSLMGDLLQVRLQFTSQVVFVGPLSRTFLRESTNDLIFKYGGKPHSEWVMLAQVSQVTTSFDKLKSLTDLAKNFEGISGEQNFSTLVDAGNVVVEMLNFVQEAIASVSYPAIAVTPIALYRELESLR